MPNYVSSYLPEDHIKEGKSAAKAALKAEIGGVLNVKVDLVVGSAGNAITNYADTHNVDCIVIASHQPGLQDYFLGSTAGRVVRHAHCAVHVIR